jgi:cell division topological specificity factor MinE
MSFLDYFLGTRKKSAEVAKDRLRLILAHERSAKFKRSKQKTKKNPKKRSKKNKKNK